jgi:tRNA-splicing ligase RtcB
LGVGKGADFSVSDAEMMQIMDRGSEWTLEKGFATKEDLQNTEDGGCIPGANAKAVSQRARARGKKQLGTIGSGNHFLEVQSVEEIFDPKVAKVFGLSKGQIVIMIHTGSRGLGHQTASDYIQKMEKIFGTKDLPDRELACAPLDSEVAKEYRGAMAAAANFAFVNRQLITHKIREILKKNFKAETKVVYDVAHNIAKFEEFVIEGKKKTLCVHRKGATRSFGPGRSELPRKYRPVGQPILIPGSMGTASYVLVGTSEAAEKSFASTAHGAGRVMSRLMRRKCFRLRRFWVS